MRREVRMPFYHGLHRAGERDGKDIGEHRIDRCIGHAWCIAQEPIAIAEDSRQRINIGLGERRSQAVRRMLLVQGATAAQISTVSFGEERPASLGSDEESYAMNRRVEIVYTN